LLQSVSTVSLWTLVSRVTGLVRDLIIAASFGASALTDAFHVAFRIPNLLRRLFAEGAFSQAFVPVLGHSRVQHGDAATQELIGRVATVLAAVLLVVSVLGVLGAPLLVYAMASGLARDPQAFDAAVFMTRWMFPYIAFMSLVALAAGVLNTWRHFAVPAFTPVLLNVALIGAAWLGAPALARAGWPPIYALAFGVLAGGAAQLAVQGWALRRLGLRFGLAWTWRGLREALAHSGTRRVWQLMLPALLGVGVAQLSLLINTQIASHLTPGSVTWITQSDRLMEFPTALLGVALGVVLMPSLVNAASQTDDVRYSALLDWGLRLVVLLGAPCAVALLVFGEPVLAMLFHHGAFTAHDVRQTTQALMGWGAGLLGVVAIKVLAPGYFAHQDMRTPVRIAIVVLVLTQILNALLVPLLQHAALTLSIGLGACINALWLLGGLLRRKRYVPSSGWAVFVLRVVAANALMCVLLLWAAQSQPWLQMGHTPWWRAALVLAWCAGAAALYFAALWCSGLKLLALVRRQ
jgi:putative peptidoglycan lipid II flippase